ncbi:50S ribosomal protein L3 [Patescibacteria group bacterium]|nr:MAG: 50S ribosomal protein L3 [Patescibacteria group bacterium]
MSFIIGRKIEMTQQFKEDGTVVPVTLIQAEPNTVTQVRNLETDGYVAVQVGSDAKAKLPKPQLGHLKDLPQVSTLKEFRVDSAGDLKRGDLITVEAFAPGVRVDVIGISKGRGFAGVMKRYHFHGKNATHGTKDQERMPGSIASQRQGKVIKGKRMAGRMGAEQVTVKNLEVVSTDIQTQVIAIKGAVPGSRGGLVMIKVRSGNTVWHA